MPKSRETREVSVAEQPAPHAPEDLPEFVAHPEHDPGELGAETGARHDIAAGDARGRGRDEAADITPETFRAAFRIGEPPRAEGEEEAMGSAADTGPTHTGGPKSTWGHESGGALAVLNNAVSFLISGWRRALWRTALTLKREGRQRELGVRVAALSDAGRLESAEYDSGVRAILCQLEQIAEAEAELDAQAAER